MPAPHLAPAPEPELSLPGWIYSDPEFFDVEMERVIRPSWQVVCHSSDIARAGEWRTIDYLGESVLVVRGDDGEVRAFANVCRHRGSRVVSGGAGCARRLTCPYHAWTYALDGRLIGVPRKSDYPGLEPSTLGLAPVELEAWHGFLFVRLEPGGASVAEMMAPHEAEIVPYRFEELRGARPGHASAARRQLEERRRQLFGRPPHRRRPSRPHPPVRPRLCASRRGSMSTGWQAT